MRHGHVHDQQTAESRETRPDEYAEMLCKVLAGEHATVVAALPPFLPGAPLPHTCGAGARVNLEEKELSESSAQRRRRAATLRAHNHISSPLAGVSRNHHCDCMKDRKSVV